VQSAHREPLRAQGESEERHRAPFADGPLAIEHGGIGPRIASDAAAQMGGGGGVAGRTSKHGAAEGEDGGA
jgi:hypothetical protein